MDAKHKAKPVTQPQKRTADRRMGGLWEPVEASPEEISQACMEGPPKENWGYLDKAQERGKDGKVL